MSIKWYIINIYLAEDDGFDKIIELPEFNDKKYFANDEFNKIVPELKKYLRCPSKTSHFAYKDYFDSTSIHNIPIQPEIRPYRDIVMDQCSHVICNKYTNPKLSKYVSEYYLSKIYYQMINSIHNSILLLIYR